VIRQRDLVGLGLRLADEELVTKYTFPFIDGKWTVPFLVTHILGGGPRLLRGPIRREGSFLSSDRKATDLVPVDSIPPETFEALVHFDPWWDFRGVPGVQREWIDAIVASDIARPFVRNGIVHKVHDLEFSHDAGTLNAVIAKDDRFQRILLRQGDVDLRSLRRAAPHPIPA